MEQQEEPDDPASVGADDQPVPPQHDAVAVDGNLRDNSYELFEVAEEVVETLPPEPADSLQDDSVIHVAVEPARAIQQDVSSPVIVINNINNVPEVQATIEISTEQVNGQQDDDDPVTIPLEESRPLADLMLQWADQYVELSDGSPNNSEQQITPRRKKRKRTTSEKKVIDSPIQSKEEDDEGLLCPICFDAWTLTGDHRVVSLKCGHLFGMSCIKRWMQNNPAATRGCATCKARATMRDIRFIYARAIKALDNTREEELLEDLNREKLKVIDLNTKLSVANMKLLEQSEKIDTLERKLQTYGQGAELGRSQYEQGAGDHRHSYKLSLERNIEITREPGCRALAYSAKHQLLLVSQKSTQPLFPGFSIRMLQVPGFVASAGAASMLVSSRSVRDIAIDASDDLFACAAMERMVKVFSIQNRSVQCTITPSQDPLWSCAFDKERSKFLYLGSQRGSVYVYDIRQPDQLLEEFRVGHAHNDFTGVVKICPVEPTSTIPCGGFLVCKLKSIWFYEYTPTQQMESHALNLTGAFSAMSYNPDSGLILISIRPTADKPTTLVLATLDKLNGVFVLNTQHTFEGSRVQTIMYRCAQVYLNEADTLVVSYLEDSKKLATWCTNRGRLRMQQLPMSESILDICPIRANPGQTYLAALSECRCRIYRLNTE
uniref:RING-type E3 ubiquitin transferase n=1 Tax=Anopheles epiroticus TaxID=199890 RepID=A0A182PHM1_9DIPT